jgi:hypothetical protein
MNKLREIWAVIWVGLRYPYRRKSARINVGVWALVLTMAMVSAVLDIITQRWGWLLVQAVTITFDFIMLHRAVEGLLWRRSLDKWLEERIKQG